MSTAPHESILHNFEYDAETGIFTRIVASGKARPGHRGDRKGPAGYRRVKFRNKDYQAHRLAWYFATGEWPTLQIDHVNRIRDDNRLCNLRLATASQNTANTISNGRDLPRGVTVHKSGKYQASVKRNGKNYHLGLFADSVAAHQAYLKKAKSLYGEFLPTIGGAA